MVEYGSGAAPRQIASVVTKEHLGLTHFDSHANIRSAPSAAIIAMEPTHVIQLDNSQPASESRSMPTALKAITLAANAGNARTEVPGALSL
jgi:hypothetical protein